MRASSPQNVPFIDLGFQWRAIESAVRPELARLLETGAFCLGPYVEAFEEKIAAYLQVPHAVAVNSGTSALHLSMIAVGIGPGDEVLIPALTFVATAWAPLYVGATPVLCDVDPVTGTIDLSDAEQRITSRTRAIIPVHLYGQPADMDGLMRLAHRHGLVVIEDAAQAIGARFGNRLVGSIGQFGCFSFYPSKNLGAAGEGGLVVTGELAIADRLKSLRSHGQSVRYRHDEIGFNYRMEGIQGLVLLHKLQHLSGWTDRRREIAKAYSAGLSNLPLSLPRTLFHDHVFHLYVVLTQDRDALRQHLSDAGIETGLHYPIGLHRQPCLKPYVRDVDPFPNAQRFADQCLSLPMFAGMSDDQIARVVDRTRAFFHS
jgi:dTDP-4-amino-4,6-dideoxygalactose transaminase